MLLARLHASPFQRALPLTLRLPHRQSRSSVGCLSRHLALHRGVIHLGVMRSHAHWQPRPLCFGLVVIGEGRSRSPGILRGPSPLPSITAKPGLAPKPGWNVHHLTRRLLLVHSAGTCPPSLPLWGNVRDPDGGVSVEMKNMSFDVRPVWISLCPCVTLQVT